LPQIRVPKKSLTLLTPDQIAAALQIARVAIEQFSGFIPLGSSICVTKVTFRRSAPIIVGRNVIMGCWLYTQSTYTSNTASGADRLTCLANSGTSDQVQSRITGKIPIRPFCDEVLPIDVNRSTFTPRSARRSQR